ncbi:MAG: glycosyltransferase [Nitrospirae bacterium]|nr:glycosyltransferase [Nitrospirota bacterium]
MNTPTVSVVIPAYNAEKYIAETLDSVMAQTYTDFEVLVVDDGSKDGTVSIAERYAELHPDQIRLIRKPNGGPSSARNAGIKAARGAYIAFNDADDLWLPEKLEKQMLFFESLPSNVGMTYTDARSFDDEGLWILPPGLDQYRKLGSNAYLKLLKNNVIPNCSVIVRRECFDKVGMYDQSPDIIEDYDMWLRIARQYDVDCIDDVLSIYREHHGGRSKQIEVTLLRMTKTLEKHNNMNAGNREIGTIVQLRQADNLISLGRHYMREGRMADARASFRKAYATSPELKTRVLSLATYLPYPVLRTGNSLLKSLFKPPTLQKSKSGLDRLMRRGT